MAGRPASEHTCLARLPVEHLAKPVCACSLHPSLFLQYLRVCLLPLVYGARTSVCPDTMHVTFPWLLQVPEGNIAVVLLDGKDVEAGRARTFDTQEEADAAVAEATDLQQSGPDESQEPTAAMVGQ